MINRKTPTVFTLLLLLLGPCFPTLAQEITNKLNADIQVGSDYIRYKGQQLPLGNHAFYLDGQLSDKEAAQSPFIFNSFAEAIKQLTDGTEQEPMTLYLAPWVYWVDDPDDPEVRIRKPENGVPFGMEISCEWLTFFGLSDHPQDVILASNRGQTMGSKGNFTMFNFKGDGLHTENITLGNYCNIDLEYPLNPKLNRPKRGSAIVQAQLAFSNGDQVFARNTHFISRLNLGPFWGSKRTLFDNCHFESTDDALNGSAVYLNCSLDFYSSKPFGHTSGTGAVFLNSDMRVLTRGEQYLVKSTGPVTLVDCRFEGDLVDYLGWRDLPATEQRYYQANVQLNGKPVFVGKKDSMTSVDLSDRALLHAYRFELDGKTVYNTFNLLRGDDNWDPMGVKQLVAQKEQESGDNYSKLPTLLEIKPTRQQLETGKDSLLLRASAYRFGNYEIAPEMLNWQLAPQYQSLARLELQPDGSCLVIPTNEQAETRNIIVTAQTADGLEAASVLTIAPSFLPPPNFIDKPTIVNTNNGSLEVRYKLDMPYADQSLVSWYRCKDAEGSQPIEVAVSRYNEPMTSYPLWAGDIGWYILAKVAPKHLRCHAGPAEQVIWSRKIQASDVKQAQSPYIPEFKNLSARYQPFIIPGFWSIESYAPCDTHDWYWEADNTVDAWYYGPGINGAAQDTGFVQNRKGARMRYQPVGDEFGDMKISFTAAPSKTAGQGFSSARQQYMDIGLKMDLNQMNGYALRLIRTTKYGDATDFLFVKYEHGEATPISEAVSASCYRPNCVISVELKGNKLIAHAENTGDYFSKHDGTEVKRVVDLELAVEPNQFGGVSIQHTGSVGSGASLIKDLKIEWKQ